MNFNNPSALHSKIGMYLNSSVNASARVEKFDRTTGDLEIRIHTKLADPNIVPTGRGTGGNVSDYGSSQGQGYNYPSTNRGQFIWDDGGNFGL